MVASVDTDMNAQTSRQTEVQTSNLRGRKSGEISRPVCAATTAADAEVEAGLPV